jgi:hypothetical protein
MIRPTLPLFRLTIFLGAGLMFLVQLLFARMVLPLLGGAPAVWNTAMVFYQAVLLAGYGYAHLLASRFTPRRQVAVHAAVLLLAWLALPIAVRADAGPPAHEHPVPWLLGVLAMSVGLPFFAVSATSPLLQRWFAGSGHPAAADPYFLYAASNAGSLAGLLGYPLLVEPWLPTARQAGAWAGGFTVLALLMTLCGVLAAWRGKETRVVEKREPIPTARRLRWVLLAFVPSSLLLSVTTYVSSEIAAVPMLWVLPLALYLATFMIVFARRPLVPPAAARRFLAPLLVAVALVLALQATTPLLLLAGLHLVAFFIVVLVCHVDLAADRPPAAGLTEFYFWMSLGGVLGGAFNALLAPQVFDRLAEYPAMLVAVAALALPSRPLRRRDAIAVLLPGALAAALPGGIGHAGAFGLAAVACFLLSGNGRSMAIGLAGFFLATAVIDDRGTRVIRQQRSFFGVHRVEDDGRFRRLFHGRTVHGVQDRKHPGMPLGYYHPEGPLGRIIGAREHRRLSVVGLGAGAVAAYGRAGQTLDFYEIDPVVAEIARDPACFSYLSDSAASIRVILGDARLKLAEAAGEKYDLLVLDAYGSDSVPVHLLTREALQVYAARTAAGGWIAAHVSNLHLDLMPVLADLAADAGWVALGLDDDAVGDAEVIGGRYPSRWVVMARTRELLAPLLNADPGWRWLEGGGGAWTDDHAPVLPLLLK